MNSRLIVVVFTIIYFVLYPIVINGKDWINPEIEIVIQTISPWGFQIGYPEDWTMNLVRTNDNMPEHVMKRKLWFSKCFEGCPKIYLAIWESAIEESLENWIHRNRHVLPIESEFEEIINSKDNIIHYVAGNEERPSRVRVYLKKDSVILRFEHMITNGDQTLRTLSGIVESIRWNNEFPWPEYDLDVITNRDHGLWERVDICCGYNDPGNRYPCCSAGNCTWWSSYKRQDVPDDHSWGHAWMWLGNAQSEGFSTGSSPQNAAIAVFPQYYCGPGCIYGHVAYVENVGSGNYYVSEMGCESWYCVRNNTYTTGNYGESFIYTSGAFYFCQYHSQNPDGMIHMLPDETAQFQISFTNTGSDAWVPGSPTDNVDLVSCTSPATGGQMTPSCMWPGHPWNTDTIVMGITSTVQPGNTATFSFPVEAPHEQGVYRVYFRPYHASGYYIEDWGGAHFYVVVSDQNPWCPCQGIPCP